MTNVSPDQFEASPAEEFQCSICRNILKNAHELSACKHLFCRDCIIGWLQSGGHSTKFCPIDRSPASVADVKPAHKSIVHIINNLTAKCPFFGCGCTYKTTLAKLDEHVTACPYSPGSSQNLQSTASTSSGSNEVAFKIIVKTVEGKTRIIECRPRDKVEKLKEKLQTELGIPVNEQMLQFGSKVLENGKTLIEYNIHDGNVVQSVHRFLGGRVEFVERRMTSI